MKNIATFLAIVLINSFGFAQNGPLIEFRAKENTVDYGTVSKKVDTGVRSIEFVNSGDAALVVSNVLSTPGFVIISRPNEAIMPGKSGRIDIKYNMTAGPIRKTITMETNAVNYAGGRIPVKIKGEVLAD